MDQRRHLTTALATALLASAACGNGEGPPTGPPPPPPPGSITFSRVIQGIFTQNCAFSQCHAGPNPQEGMNLSEGQAYANIVNVPASQVPRLFRVTPNQPDSSYVILKLEGNGGVVGGVATQMPLGGSLTQAQIDTIRSWIAGGAPNN